MVEQNMDSSGLAELVWESLWAECFLCIMLFIPLARPFWRYHYCHHFGDEDTESQRVTNLLRFPVASSGPSYAPFQLLICSLIL